MNGSYHLSHSFCVYSSEFMLYDRLFVGINCIVVYCEIYSVYIFMIHLVSKVIYPKFSKHLPNTVAHTIDCVCSKRLNHGLNHGLFLSLFKLIPWPMLCIELYIC